MKSSAETANDVAWAEKGHGGAIAANVTLASNLSQGRNTTITGRSADGNLVLRKIDAAKNGSITYGEARYRGNKASLFGVLVNHGLVAAIHGGEQNRISASGIVATP